MVAAAKTSLAAWPARARTSELSGGSWADGALCWAGWLGFGAAFFGMAARSKTLVAPSTPRPSDGRHVQSAGNDAVERSAERYIRYLNGSLS